MISENKIRAYTLKNAIEHDGKPRLNNVLNYLFHEGLKKADVKRVVPIIQKFIEEIEILSVEEQKRRFEKLEKEVSRRETREGLPELPNVKGKVIMRFAPSPSGPMHIGHIATGMPSSIYVKKYGGKFIIRIEDTNPENIDPEAYKMIKEESKWIFGNVSDFIIQSERIEKYYKFIEQLIRKKVAYICDCNPEKFKELLK
ncbi:MAG: glutamate--tRNA ligase, partial [archaeon]